MEKRCGKCGNFLLHGHCVECKPFVPPLPPWGVHPNNLHKQPKVLRPDQKQCIICSKINGDEKFCCDGCMNEYRKQVLDLHYNGTSVNASTAVQLGVILKMPHKERLLRLNALLYSAKLTHVRVVWARHRVRQLSK
jgi:predicted nucleic acid-binding Zn ribbon protein